jgi:malate dehydrogenase (oxaloacetate-decarboxylating)
MHRSLLRPFTHMSRSVLRIALRGDDILQDTKFNKGTAFSLDERKDFGLTGRLPYRINSLDEQCQRAYDQLQSRDSPIRKNSFLQGMREQNLVLYYALLQRHLRELIPIIYTPTEVCLFTIIQKLC